VLVTGQMKYPVVKDEHWLVHCTCKVHNEFDPTVLADVVSTDAEYRKAVGWSGRLGI